MDKCNEYFPLSSSVATSSRCEAYFKDLKHSDLGSNYKPMRPDKFVVRHIESIESISKLEHAAIKRVNEKIALVQDNNKIVKQKKVDCNMPDERIKSATDGYNYLTEQENWKSLNTEACKQLKRSEKVEIQINQEVNNDFMNNSIILSEESNLTYVDKKINNNENKKNKLTHKKLQINLNRRD